MTNSDQMTERESLIQIYSDFYKDAYGFRPRGINYHEFTLDELKEDFARFREVCDENNKLEAEANERAKQEFEARVQSIIEMGAGDRQTAMRWIVDSFEETDFYYDINSVAMYELGLGWTDYARQVAKELEPHIVARMAEAA